MAIALICEAKKSLSAWQLSRHLGIQHKTAWYLNHRIREAMQDKDAKPLGSEGQVVEIDEAFIGGKKRGKGLSAARDAKIKVLGMVERNGRIRLRVIPNTKVESLKPVIDANLSPNASRVVTDGASAYTFIVPPEKHSVGNHAEELRNYGTLTSTKAIDGAFSLLKRGLVGSFHKLSNDPHPSLSGRVLLALFAAFTTTGDVRRTAGERDEEQTSDLQEIDARNFLRITMEWVVKTAQSHRGA